MRREGASSLPIPLPRREVDQHEVDQFDQLHADLITIALLRSAIVILDYHFVMIIALKCSRLRREHLFFTGGLLRRAKSSGYLATLLKAFSSLA